MQKRKDFKQSKGRVIFIIVILIVIIFAKISEEQTVVGLSFLPNIQSALTVFKLFAFQGSAVTAMPSLVILMT